MVIGEIFLTAFFKVLFDRLMSREVMHFACQHGIRSKLEKWRKTFLMIQAVLSDAQEKQLIERAVKM